MQLFLRIKIIGSNLHLQNACASIFRLWEVPTSHMNSATVNKTELSQTKSFIISSSSIKDYVTPLVCKFRFKSVSRKILNQFLIITHVFKPISQTARKLW